MKKIKIVLLGLSLILGLGACGGGHGHEHDGSSATDSTHMEAHGEGIEYTSAYICPMHCEGSGSDKPGNCPKCGMDYVTLSEHVKNGHKHDK